MRLIDSKMTPQIPKCWGIYGIPVEIPMPLAVPAVPVQMEETRYKLAKEQVKLQLESLSPEERADAASQEPCWISWLQIVPE